jgi:hypothetical protein
LWFGVANRPAMSEHLLALRMFRARLWGYDIAMGFTDTSRAKAKAAVSAAEARVVELQADLEDAKAQLEAAKAANGLVSSLRGAPIIGGLAKAIRADLTVDRAKLQADVDRIAAELSAAESKLGLAVTAQSALIAVVGPDLTEED